jgi:putative transposase
VKTLSIEPGSPWENGSIESFNGTLRDELLAREQFDTLLVAKVLIERWRRHDHTARRHSSLDYRPPAPEARPAVQPDSATLPQAERLGHLAQENLT